MPVILLSYYFYLHHLVNFYTTQPLDKEEGMEVFILNHLTEIFFAVVMLTAHHYMKQRDLIIILIEKKMI